MLTLKPPEIAFCVWCKAQTSSFPFFHKDKRECQHHSVNNSFFICNTDDICQASICVGTDFWAASCVPLLFTTYFNTILP